MSFLQQDFELIFRKKAQRNMVVYEGAILSRPKCPLWTLTFLWCVVKLQDEAPKVQNFTLPATAPKHNCSDNSGVIKNIKREPEPPPPDKENSPETPARAADRANPKSTDGTKGETSAPPDQKTTPQVAALRPEKTPRDQATATEPGEHHQQHLNGRCASWHRG
jgi:hypothetical protein